MANFATLTSVLWALVLLNVALATTATSTHKVTSVAVVGTIVCDICLEQAATRNSVFLKGASVGLECKNSKKHISDTVVASSDEKGAFKAQLPATLFDSDGHISCSAHLRSSSDASCKALGISTKKPSEFVLKSKRSEAIIYSVGALSFRPAQASSFCSRANYDMPKERHPKFSSPKLTPFPEFKPSPKRPHAEKPYGKELFPIPKFSFPKEPYKKKPEFPDLPPFFKFPPYSYPPYGKEPTPEYKPPVYKSPEYKPPVYKPPVYKSPEYKPPLYKSPEYKPPVYKPPVYKSPEYKPPVYESPYSKPPYYKPPSYEPTPFYTPKSPYYKPPSYEPTPYYSPKSPYYKPPSYEPTPYYSPKSPYYKPPSYEPPYTEPSFPKLPPIPKFPIKEPGEPKEPYPKP